MGRKGERVAKTPMRVLPPRRGGRTVGDQSSRMFSENPQMSQMWVNPSKPRSASACLNSGSKTIFACRLSTNPLCLGMPNLVGRSPWMRAMTLSFVVSILLIFYDSYAKLILPTHKSASLPRLSYGLIRFSCMVMAVCAIFVLDEELIICTNITL